MGLEIEKKLKSYLHHIDYDLNPLGEKKIEEIVKDRTAIYNINVDQKENKFNLKNKLIKIDKNLLPLYIQKNSDKLSEWIEK